MALVDNESISRDGRWVNIIGIKEINELGFRPSGLLRWSKANVIRGGARGGLR